MAPIVKCPSCIGRGSIFKGTDERGEVWLKCQLCFGFGLVGGWGRTEKEKKKKRGGAKSSRPLFRGLKKKRSHGAHA